MLGLPKMRSKPSCRYFNVLLIFSKYYTPCERHRMLADPSIRSAMIISKANNIGLPKRVTGYLMKLLLQIYLRHALSRIPVQFILKSHFLPSVVGHLLEIHPSTLSVAIIALCLPKTDGPRWVFSRRQLQNLYFLTSLASDWDWNLTSPLLYSDKKVPSLAKLHHPPGYDDSSYNNFFIFQTSGDPFMAMIHNYTQRGGSPEEFVQALMSVSRDISLNKFSNVTPPSSSTGSVSPTNSASGSNQNTGSPFNKFINYWHGGSKRPREEKESQEEEVEEDEGNLLLSLFLQRKTTSKCTENFKAKNLTRILGSTEAEILNLPAERN